MDNIEHKSILRWVFKPRECGRPVICWGVIAQYSSPTDHGWSENPEQEYSHSVNMMPSCGEEEETFRNFLYDSLTLIKPSSVHYANNSLMISTRSLVVRWESYYPS